MVTGILWLGRGELCTRPLEAGGRPQVPYHILLHSLETESLTRTHAFLARSAASKQQVYYGYIHTWSLS